MNLAAKRRKPVSVTVGGRAFASIKDAARFLDVAPSTVKKGLINGTKVKKQEVALG